MTQYDELYADLLRENPELIEEPWDRVVGTIGVEGLINLSAELGGGVLYVPTIEGLAKKSRNIHVRKDIKSGLTYSQLTRKYGVCERTIRNIVNPKR